jgi:hypothetical protein
MATKTSSAAASLAAEADENIVKEMDKILQDWRRRSPRTTAIESRLQQQLSAKASSKKRG